MASVTASPIYQDDSDTLEGWDETRRALLTYVERRLDDPQLRLGPDHGQASMSPTQYHDGHRQALTDAATMLERAQSFVAVFRAARTLKRKMKDAYAKVEYADRLVAARHHEEAWDAFADPAHVDAVLGATEFHMGQRDAYAYVVAAVQGIYTL